MKKQIAISLGNKCQTAQYAVKVGIRQTKEQGYKTCPYDVIVSNVDGIIHCIDTDFKYFCDPSVLLIDYYRNYETNPNDFMLRNTKYDFIFLHESSYFFFERYNESWSGGLHHFTNDNFEKLIERYQRRIENFNYYCSSDKYYVTFLVQFKTEEYTKDKIDRLNKSIQKKYPSLEYTIKILPEPLPANFVIS